MFAVDFLAAVHRDHDGRVKLGVVNLEGEIAGDHAVVADPPIILFEAERMMPVIVVVAQAVPLKTSGLELGTDQCACAFSKNRRDLNAGLFYVGTLNNVGIFYCISFGKNNAHAAIGGPFAGNFDSALRFEVGA